jgi:hypothetical protein
MSACLTGSLLSTVLSDTRSGTRRAAVRRIVSVSVSASASRASVTIESWNVDPELHEQRLATFLSRTMGAALGHIAMSRAVLLSTSDERSRFQLPPNCAHGGIKR